MIEFRCKGCAKLFQVDDSLAGRRSRCKQCGELATIPTPADIPLLETSPEAPVAEVRRPRPRPPRKRAASHRDAWISFAIGFALALIALVIRLSGFVADVLMTVIHELGHVATAWILGSPALPSFDLTYGGGVSYTFGRQPILVFLVYAALAFLAYRMRDARTVLAIMAAIVGLYSVAVFSPLRDVLITAMGHGTELLLAGVFLYRAFSGSQILRSQERPLYAFLGLYIILADARFACRLIFSRESREDYALAKGGGHSMDFSRIANQHMHVPLEAVAAFFLLACVLTPLAAFLTDQYRRRGK